MRHKQPDKKNAQSMIASAKKTMDYTLTLSINEQSAVTITRNIYECFRMLGDAILAGKGIPSQDHILPIKEISQLAIDAKRPIALVDNLRLLRHNINYNGYNPTLAEVNDAISLAKACFYKAYESIQRQLTEHA